MYEASGGEVSLDGSGQRATGCLSMSVGITMSQAVQGKSGRIGHCLLIDESIYVCITLSSQKLYLLSGLQLNCVWTIFPLVAVLLQLFVDN